VRRPLRPSARPLANVADEHTPPSLSFHHTDLDSYLRSKGVKDIVLVGYQPQFCISTTAVSGQHQGFNVTVVRDCIGSHDLRSWDDKREIKGDELCDTACDLIQDALGLVVLAKDIRD